MEAGRWRAAVLQARCSACGEPAADAAQRFCSDCGAAVIAPWRQPQSLWTTLDQNDRDARIRRLEARSHTPLDAVGRSGLVAVFIAEGDPSRARSVACSAGDLPDVAQLRSERSLAAAYALATHPEATDDELRRLASNWGDDIALTVARNPLAPQVVLEALAEEHGIQGWLAVAANPGAPPSAFHAPGASPTIRR